MEFKSPILAKYSNKFEEAYDKCRRRKTGKEKEGFPIVSFDEERWNSFKITTITLVLPPMDLVKYLIEIRFIDHSLVKCKKYGSGDLQLLAKSKKKDHCVLYCKNMLKVPGTREKAKRCGSSRSARSSSWFSRSQLQMHEILMFTYYWWTGVPLNFIEKELGVAHQTIIDWASFCRELAIDVVFNNSEKIGGPGTIVEIDESKFGKSI